MEYASFGSFIVAALALLLSIHNAAKKDSKEVSEQIAQVMTRLDALSEDVQEIKDDFRREVADLKAAYNKDHDRIIRLEYSLEAAWKRIDEIRAAQGKEA